MSSRSKARAAFFSAIILLSLSGLATYFAISHLLQSEERVSHTHDVQSAIADVDWTLLQAGRSRGAYGYSHDPDFLAQFESAQSQLPVKLARLRELTRDDRGQQAACARLDELIRQRMTLWQQRIRLDQEAPDDKEKQEELDRSSVPISSALTEVTQQMRGAEQALLRQSQAGSRRFFQLMVVTLAVAFFLALALFAVHYRFLSAELEARQEAEVLARDSEQSLRRLTGRLLQLQDEERRKFSRELHDSLGQYLVGAKMNLEMFADGAKDSFLKEAIHLLDEAITETRTISHLLHPPLLDEAGLASASKWYLEGFAQRSGVEVKMDLPEDLGDLPKPVALVLFRVLQESLTNIHRHAQSGKAEVAIMLFPNRVHLKVRDFGKGIGGVPLMRLRANGSIAGVGLAGMRERVRELGGKFGIEACAPGTQISVTIPLAPKTAGQTVATTA